MIEYQLLKFLCVSDLSEDEQKYECEIRGIPFEVSQDGLKRLNAAIRKEIEVGPKDQASGAMNVYQEFEACINKFNDYVEQLKTFLKFTKKPSECLLTKFVHVIFRLYRIKDDEQCAEAIDGYLKESISLIFENFTSRLFHLKREELLEALAPKPSGVPDGEQDEPIKELGQDTGFPQDTMINENQNGTFQNETLFGENENIFLSTSPESLNDEDENETPQSSNTIKVENATNQPQPNKQNTPSQPPSSNQNNQKTKPTEKDWTDMTNQENIEITRQRILEAASISSTLIGEIKEIQKRNALKQNASIIANHRRINSPQILQVPRIPQVQPNRYHRVNLSQEIPKWNLTFSGFNDNILATEFVNRLEHMVSRVGGDLNDLLDCVGTFRTDVGKMLTVTLIRAFVAHPAIDM
jgi:hypothetical protein